MTATPIRTAGRRSRGEFRGRRGLGTAAASDLPRRIAVEHAPALPAGAVDISLGDDEMAISAGRSQFSVRPLSLSDYPAQVESEAVARVEESGIVFPDEIDKICSREDAARGPDVSREGVQRDLLPIVVVVVGFQTLVLRQPFPDVAGLVVGALFVVLGLMLFVQGLELGLFPIGEAMAHAFARKGSLTWLLLFAFALGFGTTVAEPALIAVAEEASEIAASGKVIENTQDAMEDYADGLRLTVALSVGFAILVGVLRIIRGWPIHYLIIAGYIGVVIMTAFAPPEIIGIAYDSGGVTTSTITVPLVTALGIGLASSISGRNPMIDGFGLIAFASLLPIIFLLIYGILI